MFITNFHSTAEWSSNVVCIFFQHVKAIAETGCTVIVAGGKVGELYLHYCNKFNIMVVRLLSKFDLRRLCKAINATPLPRIVSQENGMFNNIYKIQVC